MRCPCYQETFDTIQEAPAVEVVVATNKMHHRVSSRERSLLTAAESFDEDDSLRPEGDELTGVLENGDLFVIKRVVVEGPLHKKGTGQDWMGSKGWKARWARLALGRVQGYGEVDVPIFCVSWYRSSGLCSNVIVLDGMVVLKTDTPGTNKWHKYRFDLQHAGTSKGKNTFASLTRTFTAPSRKARDAWVYSISQELLSFEKQRAAYLTKKDSERPLVHTLDANRLQRLTVDDGWISDQYPSERNTRQSGPASRLSNFPKLPRSPNSPRVVIPEKFTREDSDR